jgi:hypothetical protein
VNLAHQVTEALHSGGLQEKFDAVSSISYTLIEVCWRLLLVIFAGAALLFSKRRDLALILVLSLLVGYFWLLTGPSAMTRYRIVSEPWLLTLATIGAWQIFNHLLPLYRKLFSRDAIV